MKGELLDYINGNRGSIFIAIILIFVVVSILGMGLMFITASNFKMTGVERNFQSTYYIAEAGINRIIHDIGIKVDELSDEEMDHDEFFNNLNEYIDGLKHEGIDLIVLDDIFEKSFGNIPRAEISIDIGETKEIEGQPNHSKEVINYTINSIGIIGDSKRKVSTTIGIAHEVEVGRGGHHPAFDFVMFSGEGVLKPAGGAKIDGPIYGRDIHIDAAGTVINGSIISEEGVVLASLGELIGDIYAMEGGVNITASSARLSGNIHAIGDVIIGHGTTINGNIYTSGGIELKSANVNIEGDIHSQENVYSGSKAKIKSIYTNRNVETTDHNIVGGNIYANGDVMLGWATKAGDIYTRGNVNQEGENTVGNIYDNPISPQAPDFSGIGEMKDMEIPFLDFEPGLMDKLLQEHWENKDVQLIEPGYYRNLKINYENTIRFNSGNYYFKNIEANNSRIKLQYDLSEGPINIYVKENVKFGGDLNIYLSEDGINYILINDKNLKDEIPMITRLAGKIYWEVHKDFKMAENCYFVGTILAKNNLSMQHAPKLVGAYIVKQGSILMGGYEPIFYYAPPTDSAAGGGDGDGPSNGDGKGKNAVPKGLRITTVKPTREER